MKFAESPQSLTDSNALHNCFFKSPDGSDTVENTKKIWMSRFAVLPVEELHFFLDFCNRIEFLCSEKIPFTTEQSKQMEMRIIVSMEINLNAIICHNNRREELIWIFVETLGKDS